MPSATRPTPIVKVISKHSVKPPRDSAHDRRCHLAPWDIAMLSVHYIQKGLLFTNLPPSLSNHHILDRLKTSLSTALRYFYPLAGRFVAEKHLNEDGQVTGMHVYIDCNDEGADFIYAAAENISATDVLAQGHDIPSFVNSFFPLNGTINYDGHSAAPLLSIQVTELITDGALFVACCFNHAVGDGTSYWNFFNAWAEIARGDILSRTPRHEKWFIEGENPPIKLPFSDPSEFIERFSPPNILRERFFHFSADSMAKLKARANKETATEKIVISSFQALSAMIWRVITRARRFQPEQLTSCRMAIQNRARLHPPQSPNYFGNSIYSVQATVASGELVVNELGWAARQLNEAVARHNDTAIRGMLIAYHKAPVVYKVSLFDPKSVMIGSSPRFDMYGCDFGWGKAVALRSGKAHKFDGKVSAFPGREGGGSVDLEVCLIPEYMEALLQDTEFIDAVSLP